MEKITSECICPVCEAEQKRDLEIAEKEIHDKIQALRNEIYRYIKENKLNEFNNYATAINNKFVDLLILNELIHEFNKKGAKNETNN